MLWDAADKVKCQCQHSYQGFSNHREKRGDNHNDQRWFADRLLDLPFEGRSHHQNHWGNKRQRTSVDDKELTPFHPDSAEYEWIAAAGPSHQPIGDEEDEFFDDEEEETPITPEAPVEELVEGQSKDKGKTNISEPLRAGTPGVPACSTCQAVKRIQKLQ